MAHFTDFLAVIGHPIQHSLSPVMHNAALRALSIDAVYTAYDVSPERLADAVQAMRTLEFRGFNVTIPHKEAMLGLVDECTERAVRIGAVNTVYQQDGRWIGDNTDGVGYMTSLRAELQFDPIHKRAAILGAGGAARSIADALLAQGLDELYLLNHHREKAEDLARHLEQHHRQGLIRAGGIEDWPRQGVDLLVNTTPVGMAGHLEQQLPLPAELLGQQMIVSDVVYRPLFTPLLAAAKVAGAMTHSGLGMLVEQGALAFALWFGVPPSTHIMREAALTALDEGEN